ncbi:uncharacterized protein LOC135931889 isoform X2 [Gordionus sp. m RMFG-2023]|uniref:uncharacterized protein LOC135931889 isoform X2 n=1 Tax=Gordionus sp. m RMFG-2023 TaxID=3053472 RepID=UPI0031FE339C
MTAISNCERKVNANYNIHQSDALKNCTEQMKNQHIYKRISYICKQGGIFKSKGKSLRNTKSFRQNCTSNFVVKLIKRGTNQLVVTRFHDTHNHELDSNLYKRLFKQRKLNDKEKEYIIAGHDGNISKIQSDIQKLDKLTTKRDLYNLKYKIPINNSNELSTLIATIKKDNPTNIIQVLMENDNFKAFYFQTPKMREYFDFFPEILLIDATYSLNKYILPVITLFVVDGFVCIWVDKSESYSIVKMMCDNYNSKHDKIRCIISDKDFADRHAYKDAFPEESLEICLFHVFWAFNQEITVNKRNISKEQVKIVKKVYGLCQVYCKIFYTISKFIAIKYCINYQLL